MFDFIWSVLFFIVALGLLITIHELGHFWVARYCGVRVERFSFGFGKPLFSWYDKKGTEFVIAPILLGGYVKMLDVRNQDVPAADLDEEFTHKPLGQRAAIMFAGPFANFVLAVIVLWLAAMVGQTATKPIIGQVEQGSIFARAGISNDDMFVSIEGKEMLGWRDVNFALVREIGDDAIHLRMKNVQTAVEKDYVIDISKEQLDQPGTHIFTLLGFRPYRPAVTTKLYSISEDSAASRGGLQAEDKIVAVDDKRINGWPELVSVIESSANKPLNLTIVRNGSEQQLTVIPDGRTTQQGKQVGFLGVVPMAEAWPDDRLIELKYSGIDSIAQAFNKTGELIDLSFVMIAKLFTGDVSVKNLSGPISIAQGAGNSAERGLYEFLWFLALISVNLGVINLLPLPMLDGGHLFYYTIELIRGKSVSQRAQEIGLMCGAIVLFLLMGISLLNDISRLS